MKIHHGLLIGQYHTLYCEDYLVIEEIGKNKQLFAVLDGCSSGNESYFASALIGKIIRKIAIERKYLDFMNKTSTILAEELKEILSRIWEELKRIKNQLLLNTHDILSTISILLYDSALNICECIVVGDGVVAYNGKIIDFDQQNTPDYMAYHLDKIEFESWFRAQKQHLHIENATDISICTDGIHSFNSFQTLQQDNPPDIPSYLLLDTQFSENTNMIMRKLSVLEKDFGQKPMDDLAIIRLMNI